MSSPARSSAKYGASGERGSLAEVGMSYFRGVPTGGKG